MGYAWDMIYARANKKLSAFLALILLFCVTACVRETPSFPVDGDEQNQDDEYLKKLYDTRAVNTIGAHYVDGAQSSTDYNRTVGRTGNHDYLRNREFRLNMVGNRILMAAYPLCPHLRRSRSMMVGVTGSGIGRPQVEWAITPFGQQDKATLKLGDEILGMGSDDIAPGIGGLLRARAILMDAANRMMPLKFRVQRDGEILRITQQPVRFCSYDFKLVKGTDGDTFNAHADDRIIYINQSVFNQLSTDDELAALIGHETSHNILRHYPKRELIRIGTFMTAIFTFPADILSGAAAEDETLLDLHFAREIEDEADYVGIYLSAAAGYDPDGALSLHQVIAHIDHDYITGSGDEDQTNWFTQPFWLSDHPPTGARYTQLRKAVEEIKLKQQEGLPVMPEFLD